MSTQDTADGVPRSRSAAACPLATPEKGSSRLVVAFDCDRPTTPARRLILDQLDELIVSRGSPDHIERTGRTATLFLGNPKASRRHLVMRRTLSGWQLDDLGSKNGTFVNGEPVEDATLADGDVIEAGGAMLMFLHDNELLHDVQDRELGPAGPTSAFETLNLDLEQRARAVMKLAPSRVPILVRGETGTGKEVIARAIHDASGRRGAFVPVNCGALPRELIESELFGHRRGAFSGAADGHDGLIRRAHQGTLFLDEIAELPPESQVALLRVLQDGEVRPVGASDSVSVDVRVIAATHQDIQQRTAHGRFRQDLYGRLSGYELQLPALRHRREDLGMLIAAILPKVSAAPELVTFSKTSARALFSHAWPLNIRELQHALQVALGLGDGQDIRVEHLPSTIRKLSPLPARPLSPQDRALRAQLIDLLRRERGNIAAVARTIDRAPVQIRRWCSRLQIDLASFRL